MDGIPISYAGDPPLRILDDLTQKVAAIPVADQNLLTPDLARLRDRLEAQQSQLDAFFSSPAYLLGVVTLEGDTILAAQGNPAIADLLGLAPGCPEVDRQPWLAAFRRCQQQGQPARFEYQPQGEASPRWLSVTVACLGKSHVDQCAFIVFVEEITERKRLKQEYQKNVEALRESEQKFSHLFDKAAFAASLSRLPDGTLVNVNETWERTFGYSREEAIGKTTFELNINPDLETRARILAQIQQAGFARNAEMHLRTKSGEERIFLVHIDLLEIAGERYILNTTQDITERQQAEARQQAAAARDAFRVKLGDALRPLDDPLEIQAETSRLLAERLGVSPDCFAGLLDGEKHFSITLPRLESPRDWTREDEALIQETAERAWAAIERARAEASLRASEQRFRTSIEAISDAFTIFSAVRESGKVIDLRYEYVNEATCRMARHAQAELVSHRFLQLWPFHRESGLFDKYVQVVETGQPLVERAISFHDPADNEAVAGKVFTLRASKYGDGLIVMGSDVTAQVRLEAEHQKVIREREIHHRLAEQREKERHSYARDIHEGPIQILSSLGFNLQYLKETYADPALRLELDQISLNLKEAVQELRQVINELRPPSVIRFGLSKAIQLHTEGLRERYPQITWNLKLANDGQLLSDQTSLALFRIYQEAVNNIVRHAAASKAWISLSLPKNQVRMEIRDNGRGFSGDHDMVALASTLHFGLAGISERVEAINGKLEIKSKPGSGTTLIVTAPLPPKAPE